MKTADFATRVTLKNVLFATDFSPCSNAALPYVLAVTRRYGACLYAAHVVPSMSEMLLMSPESWPAAIEAEEETVRAHLDKLEKQFEGIPHQLLTPRGKAAGALTQIIEDRDIDLLVLGTHGRSGLGKLVLGSVAEEIFRRAACPVLSIGPHVSSTPDTEIRFQHIVFPTDFSEESLAALPRALSLAEQDQAQLTLVHVVAHPAAGIAHLDEVKSSLLHRLQEMVPLPAEAGCQIECRLEFGRQFAPPSDRILEIASGQSADLIFLGVRPVHGKLGLSTHLASTTAQILTQAACPVLTVRGVRVQ
ncbi:MAG: universal stress protein [Terriglobales bacterium]|jgi:nucleotide-binding universal stress UspA family protein